MIIFGKAERDKFENSREEFSEYINSFYDNTKQYHDGKWLYIDRVVEKLGFYNEGLSYKYLKINGNWEDHIHMVLLNNNIK